MTVPTSSSICSSSNHEKRHPTPRRICLFGTSANPPTGKGGHVGLVDALVKSQKYDEVRILPVYQHTFSSKRNQLVEFSHRVAMCELAFSGIAAETQMSTNTNANSNTKVVVSRAEQHSFRRMFSETMTDEEKASLRVGTADLLEMLIEEEQEKNSNDVTIKTEFSFCLGADTFMDLTDWKWKRSKDVLKLLEGRLVVVNRKQQQQQEEKAMDNQQHKPIEDQKSNEELLKERVDRVNSTELADDQILLLDVPALDDVSSSKVRNSRDRDYVKNAISPRVLDYMVSHNLYGFGKNDDDDAGEHQQHQEGTIIG